MIAKLDGYYLHLSNFDKLPAELQREYMKHFTRRTNGGYYFESSRERFVELRDLALPYLKSAPPPTLASLRGIAPDATGDMSSEEFVRKLRSEWP